MELVVGGVEVRPVLHGSKLYPRVGYILRQLLLRDAVKADATQKHHSERV